MLKTACVYATVSLTIRALQELNKETKVMQGCVQYMCAFLDPLELQRRFASCGKSVETSSPSVS